MMSQKEAIGRVVLFVAVCLFIISIVLRLQSNSVKDGFIVVLGLSFFFGVVGSCLVFHARTTEKRRNSRLDYAGRLPASYRHRLSTVSTRENLNRGRRAMSEPWDINLRDDVFGSRARTVSSQQGVMISVDWLPSYPARVGPENDDVPPPYDEPPPYPGRVQHM